SVPKGVRGELDTTDSPHTRLLSRVVIPEVNLWDLESPFLYQAVVELWQGEDRCDQRSIRHGIRAASVGRHGLRLNGRHVVLRGCQAEGAVDLRDLRQRGYTLIVAEPREPLCDDADQLGLFVLARADKVPDEAEVHRVAGHPSFLGWVLAPE